MNRHSTNYPLIFGIFLIILGLLLGQLWLSVIFGLGFIGVAIWLKRDDRKSKEKESKQQPLAPERLKGPCCARCGVNLTLLAANEIKTINGKKYCDLCGRVITNPPKPATLPKPKEEPKTERKPKPTVIQDGPCARCKTLVSADEAVWIGLHRFCTKCAKSSLSTLNLDPFSGKLEPPRKPEKLWDTEYLACAVCGKQIADDELVLADDQVYCMDCYINSISNEEATVS